MKKKGFIGITLTVGVLLVIALILAVIFGGLSFFVWILSISIYRIVGVAILILLLWSYIAGARMIPTKIAMVMLITGMVLVFLPFISDVLESHTLGMVLGIT